MKTTIYKNEYIVTSADGLGKRRFQAFSIDEVPKLMGLNVKTSILPSGDKDSFILKTLEHTPGHSTSYTVKVINHNF